MAVEDASVSYGDLGDKSAFPSIDAKLADAIQTVSKGHIGKILATSSTEAARRKQRLAGRQLLRLIYNQYAVDEEDGRPFELEDLMALTCPGDAHMQQFLLTWQDYLNRMATDPGEEVKRSIFHKLVKGSGALKVSLKCLRHCQAQQLQALVRLPQVSGKYARAEQAPRQQPRRAREGQHPQHQQQGSRDAGGCGLQRRDA